MVDPENAYSTLRNEVRELEGASLREVVFNSKASEVKLVFEHWDHRLITVHCTTVILCNVSMIDLDTCDSEVVDAELKILDVGELGHLEKLGYLWDANKLSKANIQFPLIYLSLVGEIYAAVVCRHANMEIMQSDKGAC